MKRIGMVSILIVATGIFMTILAESIFADDIPVVNTSKFTITDVRTLARNTRGDEITVIYAALDFKGQTNLPVLDLFYATRDSMEEKPDLESYIFNVTPMFCMSSDIYQDRNSSSNHLYRAEIPPQKAGTIIEYFVFARIPGQLEMVFPEDAPNSMSGITIQEKAQPSIIR